MSCEIPLLKKRLLHKNILSVLNWEKEIPHIKSKSILWSLRWVFEEAEPQATPSFSMFLLRINKVLLSTKVNRRKLIWAITIGVHDDW